MMRRGHAARTVLLATLFVGVGAIAIVAFGRRTSEGAPTLGVEWVQSRSGVVALSVEPYGPAAEAGLLPGDRLLRVDGRAVGSYLDAGAVAWDLDAERPTRLEIERDGRALGVDVVPVERRSVPNVYGYLALVGAAFLASGAFVAIRWPAARGSTLYGLLGAAMAGWLVASPTGRADAFDWIVHVVDVVGASLAPAILIHLAVTLSRRTVPIRGATIVAAYLPSVALLGAALWLEGLGGAYRFPEPPQAVTGLDRSQLLFLAGAVVLAGAVLARSHARSSSTLHRGQMRWMLWGLGIGLGPFVAFYVAPWGLGANVPEWADLFALPMLLVPAAFGAALSRYRLHDLDLLLRRGLAAVTLGFVVVGAYAAALLVLRRLVDDLALPPDLVTFLAALVTAVAYPKLRTWVRAGVDRAFYRARYSYRATLLEWGRELNAEMDLPALLDRLEERVRETLAVPQARVYVRGAGRQFDAARPGAAGERFSLEKATLEALERNPAVPLDDAAAGPPVWARHLFGMRVKGRVRAVLAVADRGPLDPPFSSEDRALLATLCTQTATAIEAARLVREVRQHADEVETLRSRQERILESSGVGLLLADARGRILAWNRTLEAIYGLPKEDALGRSLQEVFPLHTIRALEREIAATSPGEEARLYRHALVNRAGQRIVVNLAVSAASGEGGDGARVVTFDDATERVKLEEQVLRQERLASLGLLAAGVAHEVNTPLTGISSYTQLLLEDLPEGDPRRDALEKIEAQSRRASDIANSLLNLARPERAALEPIAVNDAVREVVRLFEPQIRGKGVRLETRLEPAVPLVAGHRGKLQQVLLNLLLNARDAVDGDGRIAISTSCRGDRVLLEVEDDGAGISEEDLPRIFDPFFTTKGRGKGTGLGLSITYGIVREHDGEMQVESVPGTFTRFRVDLPAIADPGRVAEGGVR